MRKVKNLIKKLGRMYVNGYVEMYGPAIKSGCNPIL